MNIVDLYTCRQAGRQLHLSPLDFRHNYAAAELNY